MPVMPRFRLALLCTFLASWNLHAQTQETLANRVMSSPPEQEIQELDGDLFYGIFLGEINARLGNPGQGYELILDAARRTENAQLFQRATDIALQSRSGEHALVAARAWQEAHPQSREANRYVLQILVALNRIGETTDLLRKELAQSSTRTRQATLAALPQIYRRASDKALAAQVVESAVHDMLSDTETAPSAWLAIGRMKLAAGASEQALAALQMAIQLEPMNPYAARFALDLVDENIPGAEALLRDLLRQQSTPEIRLAYARLMLAKQRIHEATDQLQHIVRDAPQLPEPWLLLGSLQLQERNSIAAEKSLQQYLELAAKATPSELQQRGMYQAYLLRAQIAEERGDFADAEKWLSLLDNSEEGFSAQLRRATLMAKQGRVTEAQTFLKGLGASTPETQRMKLATEVQLLRDQKMYAQAYAVQAQVVAVTDDDGEALYDQAMLAEKVGRLDEMESLLRKIMERNPNFYHAYNALGYSFAERGIRLRESRQLITKALEFAPDDPFITDSLGWLEYREGRLDEALRLLSKAYELRPDAEIAAHLGEVLWTSNRREQALLIWQKGLQLNPNNEALNATLKRFGIQP